MTVQTTRVARSRSGASIAGTATRLSAGLFAEEGLGGLGTCYDLSMTLAISTFIVFLIGPYLIRAHKRAHQETKKRMKDGWLKSLLTREF